MTTECNEIRAIKYARLMRRSPDNFIGGDIHNSEMPLNYYVWVITNQTRSIVVDTGFNEAMEQGTGQIAAGKSTRLSALRAKKDRGRG